MEERVVNSSRGDQRGIRAITRISLLRCSATGRDSERERGKKGDHLQRAVP